MPRRTTLKVYRTPIGFHDAYVAAPSMKAAMEAWGSDKDLFRRGEAEEVSDPALMGEPLAKPGEVIKRLRGTAAEHIEALPAEARAPKAKGTKGGARKKAAAPKKKSARPPAPRPSREALDGAEAALEAVARRYREALDGIRQREAALAKERRALEKAQDAEMARLAKARDKAESVYEKAMRRWRG